MDEEPALPVGGFAFVAAPSGFRGLFSETSSLITVLIDLGPVRLERYPNLTALSPRLVIMVASEHAPALAAELRKVAPFVGRLYVVSLDEQRLRNRSRLVAEATHSTDIGSLLFRACKLATELFGLAAAAAYLPDDQIQTLNLRAFWPRPRDAAHYSNYPVRHEPGTPVWDAFQSRELTVTSVTDLPESMRSLIKGDWGQVLIAPLATNQSTSVVQGILVCALRARSETDCHCTFLWEDLYRIEFYSDLVSILTQMLRGRDEAEYYVERVLHGAKNLLTTMRLYLSLLEDNGVSKLVRPELRYVLPNTIALLDDLQSQIERNV